MNSSARSFSTPPRPRLPRRSKRHSGSVPGCSSRCLRLYDDLRRRDSSVDTFERLLTRELERDADIDRGAERLLRQTRFLAAAFREYEARRDALGAVDEYALRTRLLEASPARPIRQVIVTVGERSVDPAGLWPADLDILTRLPLLERIDIVATRATIAAGLLDRLEKFMPGFEEGELESDPEDDEERGPPIARSSLPRSDARPYTVSRDREDELSAIAAMIKQSGPSDLERRAVVFKRPLPYVYLARDVFADAGVPYQTFDAMPLAAEPYATALDLVFEFVTSNFTRGPAIALLSSPHFSFEVDGEPLRRLEIAALNRALSDEGYFGGSAHLREHSGHGKMESGARRRLGHRRARRADQHERSVPSTRRAAGVPCRSRSNSRAWGSAARETLARPECRAGSAPEPAPRA